MPSFGSADFWNHASPRVEIDRRIRSESSCLERLRRECTAQTDGRLQPRFDPVPLSGSAQNRFGRPLDALLLGILLVGEEGRVIALNSTAEKLLARGDGLMLQGQALAAAEPSESETMRRGIERMLSLDDQHAGPAYAIARASRPSSMTPYVLLIAAIRRSATAGGPGERAALIAIDDPERPVPDLSHELRIAFEIVEGDAEVLPQVTGSHGRNSAMEGFGEWVRFTRALAKVLFRHNHPSSMS